MLIAVPLRLIGISGMALILVWLVRPDLVRWASLGLPAWARWAGLAFVITAVPLLAWTFHTLGHNLTDTVAARANSYLVTGGPYRWVRHPFYVTMTLFLLGLTLLASLWPCLVVMGIVLTLLALRTPLEEGKLEERFGDDYRQYAARTWRYIPRFGGRGGSTTHVVTRVG